MSLKTRWLLSMLSVVLVGMALTTLISSRISYYGTERSAYEWLSASQRRMLPTFHQQLFIRLEGQAQLLARLPAFPENLLARSSSEIQAHLGSLWNQPGSGFFWGVVAADGEVLAASQPACLEELRKKPSRTGSASRWVFMCGRSPALAITSALGTRQGHQGWLVLGMQINDASTDDYLAATNAEVVLIGPDGPIASSFQDSAGRRIVPDLKVVPHDVLWAPQEHFGNYEIRLPHYRGYLYVSQPLEVGVSSFDGYLLSAPLFPSEPQVPVRAVFIVPTETVDVGAFYSTMIMAVAALLLLPTLGFVVWRLVAGFAKPIAQLGDMTARVAEGDLSHALPVTREDELGRLTRDFNDMVRKLRETQQHLMHTEKIAAVGRLAAGVGHELNNPLAYVIANLAFAEETISEMTAPAGAGGSAASPTLPPGLSERLQEVSQALREAQDGARRASGIVRDLRTFARRNDLEGAQVLDVHQVIEAALKLASPQIRHRARVTRAFQDTARVEASKARLVQVFLNLLVNAAQALPDGHAEENEIRVTTAPGPDGSVVVEVSDTGTGMPPEVMGRIFEPFFTTKDVGQGTGLGLPICRNIVEGLGGSITVQSELGRGSTFRITLPAARREQGAGTPSPLAPSAHGRGERILVVDDEAFVGASAKRILGPSYDVVTVTSSREVLALVEAGERFDLVLCDLMMPQMTGMELHGELSRRDPELAARMIFLTGGAFTPEAQQFLVGKTWLEKPFEADTLRSYATRHLSRGR